MNEKEQEEGLIEAKRLLKEAGFEISVDGCGCCGSPWVSIKHQGKLVVEGDNLSFKTHE